MGDRTLQLTLPWPPTVNHYWKSRIIWPKLTQKPRISMGRSGWRIVWPKGSYPRIGKYISKAGREYRKDVAYIVQDLLEEPHGGEVWLEVDAFPPDVRTRDLDNLPKAVYDSLEHGGVFADDFQISAFLWRRRHPVPAGRLSVALTLIGD